MRWLPIEVGAKRLRARGYSDNICLLADSRGNDDSGWPKGRYCLWPSHNLLRRILYVLLVGYRVPV